MKKILVFLLLIFSLYAHAQHIIDLKAFKSNGATITTTQKLITVKWPSGPAVFSKVVLDLEKNQPLFYSIGEETKGRPVEIVSGLDPAFILRQGKRTLSPSSGVWDS